MLRLGSDLLALLQDVFYQPAQFPFEFGGRLLVRPFGVDVHDRLVGVGQHLRPSALVEHLDPVAQVDVPVLQPLGEHPHHESLLRPRAGNAAMDDMGLRKLRNELRERPVDGRKQLEQLAQ